MAGVFEGRRKAREPKIDVKTLHAKISQLTLENDFVRCARQGRGSYYYQPRPIAKTDLVLMRRMNELHLDFPFAVGRLHVATLMKAMGIEAI